MKKVNWQVLLPQNLSEDCFWTNQNDNDDLNMAKKDIFGELTKHFSLPNEGKSSVTKSQISLQVLDINSAQNLLICLRALFKKLSHQQIKKHILHCDTTVLNLTIIDTLVKFLPQPSKMKKLHEMNKNGVELSDVEKFVASLGDVERIVPRLNCIKFKLNFNDIVKGLEPDLKSGTAACEEITSSNKFGKILSLILSIGNFMNSGSKIGEATGFELAVLTEMNKIKSSNKNQSLLHFLVETIQKKFPDLLNFVDDLVHLDEAACLRFEHIKKTIGEIATSSENLQKELKYTNVSKLSEDKFVDEMSPFALQAHDQVEVLTKMMNKLQNNYIKLGKYFAFEVNKYSMEECFSNIKIFKDQFVKAHEEIVGINQAKENIRQTENCQPVDQKQKNPAFADMGMSIKFPIIKILF